MRGIGGVEEQGFLVGMVGVPGGLGIRVSLSSAFMLGLAWVCLGLTGVRSDVNPHQHWNIEHVTHDALPDED